MNSLMPSAAQPAAAGVALLSPFSRLAAAIAACIERIGAATTMAHSSGSGSQPSSTGKTKGAQDPVDPKSQNPGDEQTQGPGHIEPPTNAKRSATASIEPRKRRASLRA